MLPGPSTDNVGWLHQAALSRSTSSLWKIASYASFLENGQPKDYRRIVFPSDHRKRSHRESPLRHVQIQLVENMNDFADTSVWSSEHTCHRLCSFVTSAVLELTIKQTMDRPPRNSDYKSRVWIGREKKTWLRCQVTCAKNEEAY